MSLSPTYAHALDRGRHERTDQAKAEPAADPEGLVFVDSTGRRALLLRRAGIFVGAAFLVYAGMLGVAFMGGSSLAPSDLSPVGGGTTENSGTKAVRPRPGGVPPALRAVRLCRKDCGACRQRFGRLCQKVPAGKAGKAGKAANRVNGGNGGKGVAAGDRATGTAPVRSARPSAESTKNR